TLKQLIAVLILCASSFGQQILAPILHKKPTAAGGTWTLVQKKFFSTLGSGTGGSACAGSPTVVCTVNVSSVGAGHALIAYSIQGEVANISSITGETWTHCSNCTPASGPSTDADYVLSATGGETSFTFTMSVTTSSYLGVGVNEYAWTGSSVSFDKSGNTPVASCTSCTGQTLAITGTSDAIFQIAVSSTSGVASAATAPYATNFTAFDGIGASTAVNLASGTGPTWTVSPADTMAMMALALSGN